MQGAGRKCLFVLGVETKWFYVLEAGTACYLWCERGRSVYLCWEKGSKYLSVLGERGKIFICTGGKWQNVYLYWGKGLSVYLCRRRGHSWLTINRSFVTFQSRQQVRGPPQDVDLLRCLTTPGRQDIAFVPPMGRQHSGPGPRSLVHRSSLHILSLRRMISDSCNKQGGRFTNTNNMATFQV